MRSGCLKGPSVVLSRDHMNQWCRRVVGSKRVIARTKIDKFSRNCTVDCDVAILLSPGNSPFGIACAPSSK